MDIKERFFALSGKSFLVLVLPDTESKEPELKFCSFSVMNKFFFTTMHRAGLAYLLRSLKPVQSVIKEMIDRCYFLHGGGLTK